MSDTILEVRNLCIDYRNLSHMSIHQGFLGKKTNKEEGVVHAVKNISFDVKKGEILGIIGRNGSGKSTMLKAIGGIFKPDSGIIDTKGNKVSLMSIGVGFKPEISGRENIVISGMLLGFSIDYIRSKVDEIIEFSELGDFIDKPVRMYSSGMYSKLAFSITAVLDTDIMLIDEVLSVGDAGFRKKSAEKMRELIDDENRTVLIVSHDMFTLQQLCNKMLWMQDGVMQTYGEVDEVIQEYERYMGV